MASPSVSGDNVKIVITGANSAVGQAILRCSQAPDREPPRFIAAVRSDRAAEEIRPYLNDANILARISYDAPEMLAATFAGASAVIHLAGVLIEGPGANYEQANVAPARSIVEAAKRSSVKKIVFVSATGADENSANGYWRSKGQAEALVRASGLAYTILRVPLLLGARTEGSAALKRNATGRKAMLINRGRTYQQPLSVDDLAQAAIRATSTNVANNRTLEFVGPVSLTDREMVERASRALGHEVRVGSMPKGVLRTALTLRKLVARSGFSLDALEVITSDTRVDPRPAADELGIQLTGIDEMIRRSLEQ